MQSRTFTESASVPLVRRITRPICDCESVRIRFSRPGSEFLAIRKGVPLLNISSRFVLLVRWVMQHVCTYVYQRSRSDRCDGSRQEYKRDDSNRKWLAGISQSTRWWSMLDRAKALAHNPTDFPHQIVFRNIVPVIFPPVPFALEEFTFTSSRERG